MGLVGQGTPSHPKAHIPTPLISSSFFFPFIFSLLFSFHFHFSPHCQLQTWGLWAVPQGGAFPEGRYTSGL